MSVDQIVLTPVVGTSRLLAELAHDADEPTVDGRHGAAPAASRLLSPLSWTLIAVAALKVGLALAALVVSPAPAAASVPVGLFVLQLLTFGGAGAVLLLAHARDVRTAHLGAVLLLVASAYSVGYLAVLATRAPALHWLVPLYPDAWLPLLLARFVEEFPRRPVHSSAARALRVVRRAAAAAGAGLFTLNALAGWALLPQRPWVAVFERRSAGGTVYWTIIFSLLLATIPIALAGGQAPDVDERRRVRWFWSSFWLGFGPAVLAVVIGALPGVGPAFTAWMLGGWLAPTLELLLATVPVTVAYAVLVRRILPLRVVVRQAAQYMLARWTVTCAIVVPAVLLVADGYRHRNETIAAVFAGRALPLIVATAFASAVLVARESILRLIDRWFFREACDAREVLVALGTQARQARRIDELVAVLTSAVDRALQPEAVAMLVKNRTGDFVSLFGSVEPLPAGSVLVEILAAASEPLDVQLDVSGALHWLPRDERQWLVDCRSRLLVPLQAAEEGLAGILTVAERRSELPFSREDRQLLLAIADAGALTLEHHAVKAAALGGEPAPDDFWAVSASPQLGQAGECATCGRVEAAGDRPCARCGATLRPSGVPHVMFGKFRFEERVGRGGMGIVYRATDLALDRDVAIKTLPGTSPEDSQRLRREAKAMAAVAHRNLAVVYSTESWRGRPMLICEFMSRGTLANRLAHGPLPWPHALSLGIALADALRVIHDADLLHRDIKPSNIGYAADGVPKLLDFGLVRMLAQSIAPAPPVQTAAADGASLAALSVTRPIIGTPLYLSPEAAAGHDPSIAFNLWSLNVLLCEAVTGRHPFRGRTLRETLDRIRAADVEREALVSPGTPAPVAAYLRKALARDPGLRPRTALDVAEQLRALRS